MTISITYGESTIAETEANDGTVAGSVTITVTDLVFAGNVGESLLGDGKATITNLPAGLEATLLKASETTATLSVTGTTASHATDVTNLTVTLVAANFTGNPDLTGVDLVKDDLLIKFDAPAGGGSEVDPNAPEEAFGGPLLITSVKDTTGDNVGKLEKVTLTGYAATPGVELTLFNGTKKLDNKVTVNENGTWTAEFTPAKAGVYNLSVKETFIDDSGTKAKTLYGGPSNTLTYTADDKVPPSAKVDKFKLPTADITPTITGKAEKLADVTVTIKKDTVTHTLTTKANEKGVWALTDEDWDNQGAIELTAGDWKITAKATDAAGNTSAADSKEETVTVDTEVSTFSVTKGLSFSKDETWATKKLSSQKLEGTADANSVIQFFGGPDGSVPLGKPVKVNKNGAWKATLKLTDGEHVVSALVTDQAGNQKTFAATANAGLGIVAATGLGTIKVDSFAPIVTVKKETTPSATTFTGSVEHDAVKVEVSNGKTVLGTATIDPATGTWSYTHGTALTGKVKISAQATDAAGNVSKPSAAVTYDFKEAEGGGGGGAFTVTATDGVLAFAGTAAGDITVTKDASDKLTFTRGGTDAETKPAIADLAPDGIPTTATLVMDTAVFTAIDAKLADTAVVTLSDASGNIAAADLVIIGTNTATATLANDQTITGTASDVIAALATADTKVVMATGKVATVDLADGTQSFTAAELTSVYGALGGTVRGTAADTITVTTLTDAPVAATESIDTFVFGANDTNVGITDFTFGAGGDKLNVSAFINAALAASLNVALSTEIDATALNVLGVTNLGTPSSSNFGGTANSSTIQTAANQKLFLVADDVGDGQLSQSLYYVTTNASNVATVTLVGTINPGTLHEENFITV